MRHLVVLLITVLAIAGCGSSEDPPAPSTGPKEEAQGSPATADVVQIRDFKYVPENVTVDVGTKLSWRNEDTAPHTATADDGSFDTGNLRKGETGDVTLREKGTFAYFCEFHEFMRAKITVR